MSLKLLFVQLNEINFDLVDEYILASKKNKFTNLKIIKNNYKEVIINIQNLLVNS